MIALPQLDRHTLWFPPLEEALDEPNGLLAFGGDLQPQRILAAYRRGIFPWYQDGQPILWWSPEPRAILIPSAVNVSRSMRKVLRNNVFTVTLDRDFAGVISACAAPTEKRPGTWITTAMQQAYGELHRQGYAHSVEVWHEGKLVGGLYGIALGAVFFGESMFSRMENASKVALIRLAAQLQQWGFAVIDCQVASDHLRSMGACDIRRSEFRQLLERYTDKALPANTGKPWSFDPIEC